MPRFVILTHDSPRGVHYDLMLESGEVLKTWALPQLPVAGITMECEALADHRPLYLEYEGPISGGRGSVARFDHGNFVIECWTSDETVLQLCGEKLAGQMQLRRVPERLNLWRLSFTLFPSLMDG